MNPKIAENVFELLFLLALLLIPAVLCITVFLSCTAGFAGFLGGVALILLLSAAAAKFSDCTEKAAEALQKQNLPYRFRGE